jgi:regulator of nonsense transcripts 1
MEGAFTHLGNHLVSDSAAAINAGGADVLSNIDPDESLLYGVYGGRGPRGAALGNARRRHDDDDNETEVFDDDDEESLVSVPVDGVKGLKLNAPEEEKELPAHACAYVQDFCGDG